MGYKAASDGSAEYNTPELLVLDFPNIQNATLGNRFILLGSLC